MIFIGGAMRSGTTLMQSILCNDTATFPMTAECYYLQFLMELYNNIKFDYWDGSVGPEFNRFSDFQNIYKQSIDNYINYLYTMYNNRILVLKGFRLSISFSDLNELYPDSKFILMVRDPRDTISSLLLQTEEHDIESALSVYIDHYYDTLTGLDNFNNILLVRYEELLTDTNKIMQQLRDFTALSLDFDPAKKYWIGRKSDLGMKGELDGKPVSKSNVGKHKTNLSEENIQYIQGYKDKMNEMLQMNMFYEGR